MGFFGNFSTIAMTLAAVSLLLLAVAAGRRGARTNASGPVAQPLPDNVIPFRPGGLTPRERRIAEAHALGAEPTAALRTPRFQRARCDD